MARLRGSTGKWGALLDSTVDRISDAAVLGAVVYWLATSGQHRAATVDVKLGDVFAGRAGRCGKPQHHRIVDRPLAGVLQKRPRRHSRRR
jgi:hypothetical protein